VILRDSNWQRFPIRGQEFVDGVVGGSGDAAEDVAEVSHRVVTVTPGTHDEGVDHRTTPTCLGVPNKEPVPLSNTTGSDGVFDEVVVDFESAVSQIPLQSVPFCQGVAHGFAKRALRQHPGTRSCRIQYLQARPHCSPERWSFLFPLRQPGFVIPSACLSLNPVKPGELEQEPSCLLWIISQGFVELAPGMRQTPDSSQTGTTSHQGRVHPIGIGLDGSRERTQHRLGSLPTSTRSEVKEDISLRSTVNPKVSGGCLSLNLRIQHPNGGFIDLEVITSHQTGLDPAPERLKRDRGGFHPTTQGCPGDIDPVALQFLLHPVEGAVFEILGADDVAQESRTTQTLFNHLRRHRCLDWCNRFAPTACQHRADRPPPDQSGRNEIQTLGTLFPDDTAVLATSWTLDLSRFNPFFHDFEMFGQRTTNWFARFTLDLGRNEDVYGGGGFRVLEHFIEKRELVILDLKLFGLGTEELLFETGEFEMEKAVLLFEVKETNLKLLDGESFGFVVVRHINDVACSLPTS